MKKFIVLFIACFVLSGCNPSPQYTPSTDESAFPVFPNPAI